MKNLAIIFAIFLYTVSLSAESLQNCKKVVVVGTSGSGKTTLAKEISQILDTDFIDLDDVCWLPEWKLKETDQFLHDVEEITQSPSWTIAGNQGKARHLIWPKADVIIWLDIPLSTCLWRVFKRSCSNIWNQTPICNGNFDSLSREFSKDSIVLWVLKTHSERHQKLETLFRNPQPNTHYIRLTHPEQVEAFKKSLRKKDHSLHDEPSLSVQ